MNSYDIDELSNIPMFQYVECPKCRTRTVIEPSLISYKSAYRSLEKRFLEFKHNLNELIKQTELLYGMNPQKDMLVRELEKLYLKYNKPMEFDLNE